MSGHEGRHCIFQRVLHSGSYEITTLRSQNSGSFLDLRQMDLLHDKWAGHNNAATGLPCVSWRPTEQHSWPRYYSLTTGYLWQLASQLGHWKVPLLPCPSVTCVQAPAQKQIVLGDLGARDLRCARHWLLFPCTWNAPGREGARGRLVAALTPGTAAGFDTFGSRPSRGRSGLVYSVSQRVPGRQAAAGTGCTIAAHTSQCSAQPRGRLRSSESPRGPGFNLCSHSVGLAVDATPQTLFASREEARHVHK